MADIIKELCAKETLTGAEVGFLELETASRMMNPDSTKRGNGLDRAWLKAQVENVRKSGDKLQIWYMEQYGTAHDWIIRQYFQAEALFQQAQVQIKILSSYAREQYISELTAKFIKNRFNSDELPGVISTNTLDSVIDGPKGNIRRRTKIASAQILLDSSLHRLVVYNAVISFMTEAYGVPSLKYWKSEIKYIQAQLTPLIDLYENMKAEVEAIPDNADPYKGDKLEAIQDAIEAVSFEKIKIPIRKLRAIRDAVADFHAFTSIDRMTDFDNLVAEFPDEEQDRWGDE